MLRDSPCLQDIAAQWRMSEAMRRTLCVTLSATCLVAWMPAVNASAACALDGTPPPLSVGVPTLDISVTPDHTSVRRGQVVKLRVDVRSGAANGVKVGSANVTIELKRRGKTLTTLTGTTTSNGSVTLTDRVSKLAPLGPLTALATASQQVLPSYDCTTSLVHQDGTKTVDPLMSVTA